MLTMVHRSASTKWMKTQTSSARRSTTISGRRLTTKFRQRCDAKPRSMSACTSGRRVCTCVCSQWSTCSAGCDSASPTGCRAGQSDGIAGRGDARGSAGAGAGRCRDARRTRSRIARPGHQRRCVPTTAPARANREYRIICQGLVPTAESQVRPQHDRTTLVTLGHHLEGFTSRFAQNRTLTSIRSVLTFRLCFARGL